LEGEKGEDDKKMKRKNLKSNIIKSSNVLILKYVCLKLGAGGSHL
jgi:hypothetical protein